MTGVPAGLRWWAGEPGGAEWLARLPALVAECASRWGLRVGEPFAPASVAWVAPATLLDGTPAVLKVGFPDTESEHEADALAAWDGSGAVRLLAADAARRALLVERCSPGAKLWSVADETVANARAAEVLRALWAAAAVGDPSPFRSLGGEAARWRAELPGRWERHGRPVARAVVERAVGWIAELVASPAPAVLVHQDLHGGNVLSGRRAPWLAIDPKPLLGDRELDVASLLRDRRWELATEPAPVRRMRRRLDQLCAELDLDRERARRWAVVHALAWGLEERSAHPAIVRCAEWLAAA